MSIEDAIYPNPDWVDSNPDGEFSCNNCSYKSCNEDFLQKHQETFHNDKVSMILYYDCAGSIEGRNAIAEYVNAKMLDMTGGQAAFVDNGDFDSFAQEVIQGSKETGYQVYNILHMEDPGLGLIFPSWFVEAGITAGTFKRIEAPNLDS